MKQSATENLTVPASLSLDRDHERVGLHPLPVRKRQLPHGVRRTAIGMQPQLACLFAVLIVVVACVQVRALWQCGTSMDKAAHEEFFASLCPWLAASCFSARLVGRLPAVGLESGCVRPHFHLERRAMSSLLMAMWRAGR